MIKALVIATAVTGGVLALSVASIEKYDQHQQEQKAQVVAQATAVKNTEQAKATAALNAQKQLTSEANAETQQLCVLIKSKLTTAKTAYLIPAECLQ